MKIFTYTMVFDTGFAPAVYNMELSLACCKTILRHSILKALGSDENIYMVGLCGQQLIDRNNLEKELLYQPVYIAKVSDAICTDEYYSDKKYKNRPDVQYEYKNEEWYYTPNNPHHSHKNQKSSEKLNNPQAEKDIYYIYGSKRCLNYSIICDEYIKFGKNIPKDLPNVFDKISKIQRKSPRSYRVVSNLLDSNEMKEFVDFFNNNKDKYKNENTIDKYFIDKISCGERHCR